MVQATHAPFRASIEEPDLSDLYDVEPFVPDDEPGFGAFRPRGLQALLLRIVRIQPLNRGRSRRRVADLVRGFAPDGVVDTRMRGAAFRLRGRRNLIEDAILVRPGYNRREIDFLIAGTPIGGVFVDLGANVGLYTLPLALHVGAAGRVLAVDANAEILRALAFNAHASGCANVRLVHAAVSDEEGRAHLEIRKDDLAIVEVAEDPAGPIPVRTLAALVGEAGLERVDSVKADIENFEDRALLPYLESAAPTRLPSQLVLEHSARPAWKRDCFPILDRLGYEVVGRERSNTMLRIRGPRG